MISLVSNRELNRVVLGNLRAWIYPNFMRIPTGSVENPECTLPVLKWTCDKGCILFIIVDIDLVGGIAEICFFDFGKTISPSDIKNLCTYLINSYSFQQIRTKLPEGDELIDPIIEAGFEHIATMKEHLRLAYNVYANVQVLNYTAKRGEGYA